MRRPTAGHRGPWLRPCRPLRARRRCRWLRCRPGAGARRARSLRATETNGSGCWWAARCRHVQCPQLAAVDRRSIGVVIQPSRLVRAIPTRCCRRRPSAPPDGHREGACERCPSDPRPPTRLRVRSTGRVSRCPSGVWCLKETERTLSLRRTPILPHRPSVILTPFPTGTPRWATGASDPRLGGRQRPQFLPVRVPLDGSRADRHAGSPGGLGDHAGAAKWSATCHASTDWFAGNLLISREFLPF